jgi:hypothetical protein
MNKSGAKSQEQTDEEQIKIIKMNLFTALNDTPR